MIGQVCKNCKYWLSPETVISHSICMKVRKIGESEANIWLRELGDEDFDGVEDEDLTVEMLSSEGPEMFLFESISGPLKYVSMATRADFSCQAWEKR